MGGHWSRIRVVVVGSILAGCGLVSGLDNLTVEPDNLDGGASSGTSGASGSSGASSSGTSGASSSGTSGASSSGTSGASSSGTITDGGPDGPGPSDTGLDSPAVGCASNQACVPPVPVGWTPVWFTFGSTCGAGYPTGSAVAIAAPDTFACQSNCNPGVDTCGSGTYSAQIGGGATCSATAITLTPGGCTTVPGTPAIGASTPIKVVPPPAPNGCSAQASVPPTSGASGEVCTGATVGGACTRQGGGGGVCVPPGNFNGPGACVMGALNTPCPTSYSQPYTIADTITDGRTCTAAICGTAPCTGGSVSFYAGGSCNVLSDLRQATDGTCTTGTNAAFTAAKYHISPSSGCTVTTPGHVSGGSVSYGANAHTVCCTGGN